MGEEAERVNAPVYTALTKFFRAYYFYELTLRFGDIPYSQALKGEKEEIYTPEYDAQEDVFAGVWGGSGWHCPDQCSSLPDFHRKRTSTQIR